MDSPFIWGEGGSQLTPEQIAARRKAAEALMAGSNDYSPIRSAWQGVARAAQGVVGGFEAGQTDRAERSNADANKKLISDLLSGGSAAATPAASISTSPAVGSAAPSAPAIPMGQDAPAAFSDRPKVASSPTVMGDDEAEAAGLYEPRPGVKTVASAMPLSAAQPAPVAAGADPAAIPAAAQPTQGSLPQTPVAKVAGALNGVNPNVIAALTSPYASESTKKIAGAILTAQMSQEGKAPISVAKGASIVDPRTGRVVYKSPDEEDDKPKWGVVGKDQYGQPTYGYPPTRAEAAAAKAAAPTSGAPADGPDLTNVHGKEYMDTIAKSDPKYASQVQAIIEGRAPYPTGMLLKTPYGQRLAQDVTQADPSFESGNATARVKTRNEFMTGGVGSPAGQITAGNTALQHAGEMSDALERMKEGGGIMRDLGNAGIPVVSYAANQIKNKSVQGTPEGAALNDFMTAKNHFSEEVTKFYAGSAGSEAERTRALANLDAAKSLPELRSAIKTEVNLMQGKVNALQDRWKNGMGPLVPEFPLIQPKSQDAINRVIQRHQASEVPATGGGAVDPDALAEAKRRGLIH